MSRYRILEKKGTYEKIPVDVPTNPNTLNERGGYYTPRYIVQERHTYQSHYLFRRFDANGNEYMNTEFTWKDLKEFNNLQDARKFKRDLELEDGIIIE